MSVTVAHGALSIGMMGQVVEVQAHISNGLPGMTIVGLPDTSISESRDRVRSAVTNCGFDWPVGRITIGLSPAFEHKRGPGLDLAVAMAVLSASGAVPPQGSATGVFLGELGLDGSIRPVPGAVSLALGIARALPGTEVFASSEAAATMGCVPGITAVPVDDLAAAVEIVKGARPRPDPPHAAAAQIEDGTVPDLAEVLGQRRACRCLEVAAAGGHHLMLEGPPGVGKTMLAQRLPGLLPPLDDHQALEVAAIRDAVDAGVAELSRVPPFRSPHHSTTHVAMVGGAARGMVRPGQISLAHHGVLFLDEAPEFSRLTLESLRQPLEEGVVCIARAAATERLPARFQLILAANPCPCGEASTSTCRCSAGEVRRYQSRLSGPLLDRIDMRVPVQAPLGRSPADPTADVRDRVLAARERASRRWEPLGHRINARIPGGLLRKQFPPDSEGAALLERWSCEENLSMRSLDRICRVSWTLADLSGLDRPGYEEIAEAAVLRRPQPPPRRTPGGLR